MILTKFEIFNTPTIFFKPVAALINSIAQRHTLDTVINNQCHDHFNTNKV